MKLTNSYFQFSQVAKPALFVAAVTLASSVSASPMTLELDFRGSPFAEGSKNMRIHFDNRSGGAGASQSVHVAAGMFSGEAIEGGGTTFDTSTLFTDPNNVLAYCVDILKTLQDRAVYTVEEVSQSQVAVDENGVARNFGRMLSFLGAVNHVQQRDFASSFETDSKNWLRPNSAWMSAAIQLGIWESLYENSALDLSVSASGQGSDQWFWATNVNIGSEGLNFLDDAFSLVNANSSAFSPVSASEVRWAINANGQDLIIDPVDVPVPATGLLFLGGLAALAWRRRGLRWKA